MHTELDGTGRQLDLYLLFNKAAEGTYECVSTNKDGQRVSLTYVLNASGLYYICSYIVTI